MDHKNIVSAICPQCGSQQEVDPTQDAAICRYCGKPFAVQNTIGAFNERHIETQTSGMDYRAYASPRPMYTEPQKAKKRRTFWWVMGWIFCFPIPLTILVARSKRLGGLVKAVIIAAAWIVYLALGTRYRTISVERTPNTTERTPAIVETTSTPRPTTRPTATPKPTVTPEPVEDESAEENSVEKEPEVTPESTPDPPPVSTGVTPEFKEAMDSYETFFDEYCEFMKNMSDDPTNFDYLLQYADMMTQYADTMEKLDAIDETELSLADDAYYIEVMARIEVKLLEAANYMS